MTNIRFDVEKRARSAIMQYAFFRWENAVILGGAILLTYFLPQPFPGWPVWGWLGLGFAGFGAMVYASLVDAESNARIVAELFKQQFNPKKLQDANLRADLETALAYQERIEAQISKQRSGLLKDRLKDTAGQIADWIKNIYRLATLLDAYAHDVLLSQERVTVPKEIQSLISRREYEQNAEIRTRLGEVVESKQKQWTSLQALDGRMKEAELQLEESLTALATIYSQIQLINVQDIESGRSERLREDIHEQVTRLNDLVASIDEVYDYV
ncbi:MAG: hypothetical protein JW981_09740 [Anaerolineae bacterium]|nr:hypothetical protein [Anaerolineae bacterium]